MDEKNRAKSSVDVSSNIQKNLNNSSIILSDFEEDDIVKEVVSKNVQETTSGKSEKIVDGDTNISKFKGKLKLNNLLLNVNKKRKYGDSQSHSSVNKRHKKDHINKNQEIINSDSINSRAIPKITSDKILQRIKEIMEYEENLDSESKSNKNSMAELILKQINKIMNSDDSNPPIQIWDVTDYTTDESEIISLCKSSLKADEAGGGNIEAIQEKDLNNEWTHRKSLPFMKQKCVTEIFNEESLRRKIEHDELIISNLKNIKIEINSNVIQEQHTQNDLEEIAISEKLRVDNVLEISRYTEQNNSVYQLLSHVDNLDSEQDICKKILNQKEIFYDEMHKMQSSHDKVNPNVENIRITNQDKVSEVKLEAEDDTCNFPLQVTDQNNYTLQHNIENVDIINNFQENINMTNCSNENTKDKSVSDAENISDSSSSNTDIDVENISDNSNCALASFIDLNQCEEQQSNFQLKNDCRNHLNLSTSLKNNNDFDQCNEKITVEESNDILDIDSDIDIDININSSNFALPSTQTENNTEFLEKHCSNNDNSLKKKSNESKDQFNLNINKMYDDKKNTNITNVSGHKMIRFFWLDAYEDSYSNPGVVYLFGKVLEQKTNQHISCCVTVKNVPRRIYVLPRKNEKGEESSLINVEKEISEYLLKKKIHEFKYKRVQKTYVFERKDVPQSTTYLEVRYSALYPAFDSNYCSSVIQAVFGTNVTAMELFLIEKNIKGPCWMDVKVSPHSMNLSSWCKIEIDCAKMEDISVLQNQLNNPDNIPITIAALTIQVSLDEKLHKYDIASIGISIQENFHLNKDLPIPLFNHSYCFISQCTSWPKFAKQVFVKKKDPKVVLCNTEVDMLEQLLELLRIFDPDILIGYDTEFEIDILVRKILSLGVKDWSRIGKLRRNVPPKFKEKIYFNQILCGRPLCDVQTSLNEFQLRMLHTSDLASLYLSALNKEIKEYKEIKPEECLQYYKSTYEMTNLVKYTITKVFSIFKILVELNILSLAMQVTKIVGNTLSRTLSCGVGERNEFLLLHVFQSNNYLTPDKRMTKSDMYTSKKKSTYTGGVILEPKAGFYDTLVLLLDFNSLYPSIIQEFNICFTTIPGAAHASVEDLYRVESRFEQGILPNVISSLVQSRLQVKKMMNSSNLSSDLRRQYNSRQLALKLTANSMYGCLGASYSRFYAKGLAALIAMRGREIFQKTKDLIQSHNYEVIYGDTDSFMINIRLTEYEQAMAVGRELQKEINKRFKNIKINIDQVFKCLLLIKKKQYAGLTITKLPNGELEYKKEIKGLEIIRRDCCNIASCIGNKVLEEILKDQAPQARLENIMEILKTLSNEFREGKIPLSSLEITKTLSKDPNMYTNKNYPHVLVAERMNKTNTRKWKAGDTISYIICEDNTARTPLERAYHVEEITANNIKVDINYYLLYQVFPIVYKICNLVEGIEDMQLAKSLGITYKQKKVRENSEGNPFTLDDLCKSCMPLKFKCRDCETENEVKTSTIRTERGFQPSLANCSNSKCNMPPWKTPYLIQNQIQLSIRKYISKYYSGEIECSNPLCNSIKKGINLDSSPLIKCYDCFDGKRYKKYTEVDLHNQLIFFANLFTLNVDVCESLDSSTLQEIMEVYTKLKEFVLDQIDCNAYAIVDLDKLFPSNVDACKRDLTSD